MELSNNEWELLRRYILAQIGYGLLQGALWVSPMPLADTVELLADGAEARPLPRLIGPALLHEPEDCIRAQLWARQTMPYEDRCNVPSVRRDKIPSDSLPLRNHSWGW